MATLKVRIKGGQVISAVRMCTAPGCDNPEHVKGACHFHYQFGSQTPIKRQGLAHGETHGRWTAQPSYTTVHTRLLHERGKASNHACVICGGRGRDWAFVGDLTTALVGMKNGRAKPYSADIWGDYQAMCRSDHMLHDFRAGTR